jgi:hypothetical protein
MELMACVDCGTVSCPMEKTVVDRIVGSGLVSRLKTRNDDRFTVTTVRLKATSVFQIQEAPTTVP